MGTKIKLNSMLLEYTQNQEIVEVSGNTIQECLDSLIVLFPGLKEVLFDTEDRLSSLVIFNREVILPNTLNTPVSGHEEFSISPMIYGG